MEYIFLVIFYLYLLFLAIQDIKYREIHSNYFVILFVLVIINLFTVNIHSTILIKSIWAMIGILVLFDLLTNIGNIFILKNKDYIQGLPLIITSLILFIVYIISPASLIYLTYIALGVFIISELLMPVYIYNFKKKSPKKESLETSNNVVMGGADSLLIALIAGYTGDVFFVVFAFILAGVLLILLQYIYKFTKYTLPKQIPFVPFYVTGVLVLDILLIIS